MPTRYRLASSFDSKHAIPTCRLLHLEVGSYRSGYRDLVFLLVHVHVLEFYIMWGEWRHGASMLLPVGISCHC